MGVMLRTRHWLTKPSNWVKLNDPTLASTTAQSKPARAALGLACSSCANSASLSDAPVHTPTSIAVVIGALRGGGSAEGTIVECGCISTTNTMPGSLTSPGSLRWAAFTAMSAPGITIVPCARLRARWDNTLKEVLARRSCARTSLILSTTPREKTNVRSVTTPNTAIGGNVSCPGFVPAELSVLKNEQNRTCSVLCFTFKKKHICYKTVCWWDRTTPRSSPLRAGSVHGAASDIDMRTSCNTDTAGLW